MGQHEQIYGNSAGLYAVKEGSKDWEKAYELFGKLVVQQRMRSLGFFGGSDFLFRVHAKVRMFVWLVVKCHSPQSSSLTRQLQSEAMSFGEGTTGYTNAANSNRCTGLCTTDFSTPPHEDNDPGATVFLPAERTICSRNCQLPRGWSVASGGFLCGGVYLDYVDEWLRTQWSFAGGEFLHGTAVVFEQAPLVEDPDKHSDYNKLIIPAARKEAQWNHYSNYHEKYDAMTTKCFPHEAWDRFFQDANDSTNLDDPSFSVITWGECVRTGHLTEQQRDYCRGQGITYAEFVRGNAQPQRGIAREGECSIPLTCEGRY
jgi:hypothetical protein